MAVRMPRRSAGGAVNDEDRRRGRVVGAFLGPNGTFPAAMHTLSDEIPGELTELESEQRRDMPRVGRRDRVNGPIRRLLHRSRP
jgi:hypothetical protein